ncbi:bifunctional 2-polyprenyl-6-hydroxyphenol methylase/3-demethylubiquinol 3-O-methyltransferase UbiG [Streptomyces sp. TLI_171]|uniref:class I SAM-dependent methyltransferase n=1 Tax=Streptomyces sp. TLI_171 TaxID=1938859 RepID=UPI000C178083|nr:class I SAM-dependent methyltransferase [Streptomyces sp. TLI_171]RKE22914.1 methyltransferase family protein [Streptomyces sp. TLI_171]
MPDRLSPDSPHLPQSEARSASDWSEWAELNRANWDERVPVHLDGSFYDIPAFVAGAAALRDFELAEVGEVTGKRLLHLQCHLGLDTLDWARRGAAVTGLDFSEPAVAEAAKLAARIGADSARFVVSDVYGAVAALGGETFDVVYTGMGALNWLPDLAGWARTAAELVRPGGFVYLAEFHPVAELVAEDGRTLVEDYFDRHPAVLDVPTSYADPDSRLTATRTVQWRHGVGDVVSALAAAGLRLEFLHEHAHGHFALPPGPRIPLVYSLRATRAS